jgi:hypothetical protein
VTESATTGADVSASGGAATAAGGAVSFAVTLTAAAGAAQASGGTVSVSVDVTPPVVVEPPSVGPTGGADFDFGDESAIYGTSAPGGVDAWSRAWLGVCRPGQSLERSAPAADPAAASAPAVVRWSRRGLSRCVALARATVRRRARAARRARCRLGARLTGGARRAGCWTMDGDPEADDLLAMTLLGVL